MKGHLLILGAYVLLLIVVLWTVIDIGEEVYNYHISGNTRPVETVFYGLFAFLPIIVLGIGVFVLVMTFLYGPGVAK